MRDLKNKRVLITGSAQGIGLSLAKRFAAERAEVILTDLRADLLEAAAETMGSNGANVSTHVLDVTEIAAIRDVRERVHAEGGPIDVLVNNAGVVFGGPFLEVPFEKHALTLEVNALGPVAMTHAFLPDLISRPEANLVNIASASGFIPLPYGSTYATSKWATIGFSESVRRELELLGHRHVRVTTVCPSYVSTGLFDGVRPPLFTPMLSPDRLTAKVLRAVKRNRDFVLTPWLVKLAPPTVALLPTWLSDRVMWWLRVSRSMEQWQGRTR